MTRCVVGIDPGGKTTGIVARRGDKLLGHWLVENVGGVPYRGRVIERLSLVVVTTPDPDPLPLVLVAVEGVKAPNPHLGVTNPTGIIATARVLGWVEQWCADVLVDLVVVPPAYHGSGPLAAYPPELVGPREKAGTGKLRHCRSAWSISYAGEKLWRLRGAS